LKPFISTIPQTRNQIAEAFAQSVEKKVNRMEITSALQYGVAIGQLHETLREYRSGQFQSLYHLPPPTS